MNPLRTQPARKPDCAPRERSDVLDHLHGMFAGRGTVADPARDALKDRRGTKQVVGEVEIESFDRSATGPSAVRVDVLDLCRNPEIA